jgi:dTMP kinase
VTLPGRFITFEGIDGAGKSSHIEATVRWLRDRGHTVLETREPGGTPLAETLRELVLHAGMDPLTEALLVFAARRDHLMQCIEPALAAGQTVVCDRFTDSTVAYQGGGRGMPATDIAALEQWVHPGLQPDRTYLFDLDPQVAAERRQAVRGADRFESEQQAFFVRVRAAYLARAAAAPQRFRVLDGAERPEALRRRIEDDSADL